MANGHLRRAEDYWDLEEKLLNPWATKSRGADETRVNKDGQERGIRDRTAFQRDRDRILHSKAFRRLVHKTQVFVSHQGDHYRNRLTHTLEVYQISRSIARRLGLNEDLTEAIALGHDLGHTPFGHIGEELLHSILSNQDNLGKEGLDKDFGGFKHNWQSLLVVDELESPYKFQWGFDGLNLTVQVREGVLKHTDIEKDSDKYSFYRERLNCEGLRLNCPFPTTLEGQVVRIADEIAQRTHDFEDGLRAGVIDLHEIKRRIEKGELRLVKDVLESEGVNISELELSLEQGSGDACRCITRGLIGRYIDKVCQNSIKNILNHWEDFKDKKYVSELLIDLDDEMNPLDQELKSFISNEILNSYIVNRMDGKARYIVRQIFKAYYENPRQLPDSTLKSYDEISGKGYVRRISSKSQTEQVLREMKKDPAFVRLICNHIAGMTDKYALEEFERLYLPFKDS